MAKQIDVDNAIQNIMETLAADALVNLFDDSIQLLSLFDANILSPRQISKKMSSYSTNPSTGLPYTDRQLNIMYYGQDLSADMIYIDDILVPNPGYTAYVTESESMVTDLAGYEPIDIRDQLKDKTHEIIREVRKEFFDFETTIKHLITSLPRAITQAASGLISVVQPQVSMPPLPLLISNPGSAAQISLNLHSVAHLLRKEVMEGIVAVRVFSTLGHLTLGANFDNTIKAPKVTKLAANGAPAIKNMVPTSVSEIPKIQFLLPDSVLSIVYDIFVAILIILQTAADTVVALDTAALALEAASVIANPASAVTFGIEIATVIAAKEGVNKAILAAISAAASTGINIKSPGKSPVKPSSNSVGGNPSLSNVATNASTDATNAMSQIKISPNNSVITIGNNTQLSDSVPGGVWTSNNQNVATVDDKGNVYGKNIGNVIITYNVSNSNITATASVTVISGN